MPVFHPATLGSCRCVASGGLDLHTLAADKRKDAGSVHPVSSQCVYDPAHVFRLGASDALMRAFWCMCSASVFSELNKNRMKETKTMQANIM